LRVQRDSLDQRLERVEIAVPPALRIDRLNVRHEQASSHTLPRMCCPGRLRSYATRRWSATLDAPELPLGVTALSGVHLAGCSGLGQSGGVPVGFAVVSLVPVVIASYLLRTILVLLFRRSAPRAAAFVDRWWAWAPLAVLLVLLTVTHPLIGLAGVIACYLFLTSSRATGSPFKPRR
jgi:hypothetical protein